MTWDWTQVSWTSGEHSTHNLNVRMSVNCKRHNIKVHMYFFLFLKILLCNVTYHFHCWKHFFRTSTQVPLIQNAYLINSFPDQSKSIIYLWLVISSSMNMRIFPNIFYPFFLINIYWFIYWTLPFCMCISFGITKDLNVN